MLKLIGSSPRHLFVTVVFALLLSLLGRLVALLFLLLFWRDGLGTVPAATAYQLARRKIGKFV